MSEQWVKHPCETCEHAADCPTRIALEATVAIGHFFGDDCIRDCEKRRGEPLPRFNAREETRQELP